jgi:hypothetical protein
MLAIKWYHIWRLRIWAEDNGSAIVIFAVLLIAAGAMSLGRTLQAGETAPQTVVLIATPTLGLLDPEPAPLIVANVATLSRAVIAYHDYQRPETATPLDAGRAYTVVGRAGFEWLLLDVGSGAPVWVRAFDAGLIVDGAVADLAPPPAPPAPAVVVVREVQQQTVYVPVQQEAPPVYSTAGAEHPVAQPLVVPQPGQKACDWDGDGECGGTSSGDW